MMEAIFSSKLYKSSNRKNKIASALSNPVNMELVQQLKSYLDIEDDTENARVPFPEAASEKVSDVETADVPQDTAGSASPSIRNVPAKSEKSSLEVNSYTPDNTSDSDEPSQKASGTSETSAETSSEDSDVPVNRFHEPRTKETTADSTDTADSTNLEDTSSDTEDTSTVKESTSVQAATVLYSPAVQASCCDKLRVDAAEIKGTLNVRDDTKGVSRIFVKDQEIWIYYQDNVNLNTVMEPVISVLNGVGFTNLEFNRLARSANAIVFDISCIYNDVEPLVEEETK